MIKHLIFDFGGVLLRLNPQATWDALASCLSLENLDDPRIQQVLIDFEIGKTNELQFLNELRSFSQHGVDDEDLITAWNAMLGTLPSSRLDMLQDLSKDYQLHLLSNTNETHIRYVYAYLKDTYGIEDFGSQYFHSHYFSHLLRQRKPNLDIYESVISDIGTTPERAMFFDDNMENIKAACDYGIKGVYHDPSLDIADQVKEYLSRFS